ncbi:MAG: type VI secretion system-associated protein TagF [Methyloprofundus sp.]|nr:type VI secretion system-associated protein TagF [Methyloprofundus sp.]
MSKGHVGFYGKLPIVGDFITRRLPQDFVEAIDSWLQNSIAVSKEILGDAWLDLYLTSPVWRFAFQPDVSGKNAWVGIMMPSVDRVGRYFPLILASEIDEQETLEFILAQNHQWFTQLEQVALAGLDGELSLEQFSEIVLAIDMPNTEKINCEVEIGQVNNVLETNLISEVKFDNSGALADALSVAMLNIDKGCSFWLQMEVGCVHIYQGLPTPHDYSRMIG